MRKSPAKFLVYNLRETYHEPGRFEFKIVLNGRFFRNSHLSEVEIVDSDGKPMRHEVSKWGRKINCVFVIDDRVSDGVAHARLTLVPERGEKIKERVSWWVIK
jgi:hypothetical protein